MTTTYETRGIPYDDDLEAGYVIGYEPDEIVRSWGWWYGPGHGWSTTFGPLDGSVAVYGSKVKAQLALKQYGGSRRDLKIRTLEQARAVTADSLERYAQGILERVAKLRGEAS